MILEHYTLFNGKSRPGISLSDRELATLRNLRGDYKTLYLQQIGVELGGAVREGSEFYGGVAEISEAMTDDRPVISAALSVEDRRTLAQAAIFGFNASTENQLVISGGTR